MGVKMTFLGLKQSEDLENWAAHPTKNSQEYHLPLPLLGCTFLHGYYFTECERLAGITLIIITVSGASGIMLRHTCKFNTHKL